MVMLFIPSLYSLFNVFILLGAPLPPTDIHVEKPYTKYLFEEVILKTVEIITQY